MINNKKVWLSMLSIVVIVLMALTTISYAEAKGKVTGIRLNSMTAKETEIVWNTVDGAATYVIYESDPVDGDKEISETPKNTVTLNIAIPDGGLNIRIVAKDSNGKIIADSSEVVTINNDSDKEKTEEYILEQVQNLDVFVDEPTRSGILKWDSLRDVTGYEIYRDVDGEGSVYYASTPDTNYPISNLMDNVSYAYKVRAYKKENGKTLLSKEFSEEKNVCINAREQGGVANSALPKVKNVKVYDIIPYKRMAKIIFDPVNGASGYELWINVNNGQDMYLGDAPSGFQFIITDFELGVNYGIKIRAYKDENGQRIYSKEFSDEVPLYVDPNNIKVLDKVENLQIDSIQGDEAYISWNPVNDATGYEVWFTVDGVIGIGSVSSNYARLIGFEEGKDYFVTILAYKRSGDEVIYSREESNGVTINITGNSGSTNYPGQGGTNYPGQGNGNTNYPGNSGNTNYPSQGNGNTNYPSNSVPKPERVTGVTVIPYGNRVTIEYNSAVGAIGYEVKLIGLGNTWMYAGTAKGVDIPIENGFYSVTVYAWNRDSNGNMQYGEESEVVTFEINNGSSTNNNAVTESGENISVKNMGDYYLVSWKEIEGAEYYYISCIYENTGSPNRRESFVNYFESHPGSSGYVTYLVEAVKGGRVIADVFTRTYVEAKTKPYAGAVDKITNINIEKQNNGYMITWNKVNGAEYYNVVCSGGGSSYGSTAAENRFLANPGSTGTFTYIIEAMKGGKIIAEGTKELKVTGAQSPSTNSGNTSNSGSTWATPGKVSNIRCNISGDTLEITWNGAVPASGYVIEFNGSTYYSPTKYEGIPIKGISNGNYIVTVYAYVGEYNNRGEGVSTTVKINNSSSTNSGNSSNTGNNNSTNTGNNNSNNTGNSSTKPSTTITVSVADRGDYYLISWNKVEGADEYVLYNISANRTDQAPCGTSTEYHSRPGSAGTVTYKVEARKGGKVIAKGEKRQTVEAKALTYENNVATLNVSIKKQSDGYMITWNKVNGAEHYMVTNVEANGHKPTTDTKYLAHPPTAGTFTYKVEAFKGEKIIAEGTATCTVTN